jgi:hypothetical protein
MFCLQCVAHSGYSSSQINATTSYTEWALSDTVDVSSLSVASCIPRLQALVGGVCLKELASIPMFHTNIAQAASLSGSGAIQVRDATGISQTATIPEEIVRQIEVGDGVIP